jgi:hypothetical protein
MPFRNKEMCVLFFFIENLRPIIVHHGPLSRLGIPSLILDQWSELSRHARVRPKSLPDDRVARWLNRLDRLDVYFE